MSEVRVVGTGMTSIGKPPHAIIRTLAEEAVVDALGRHFEAVSENMARRWPDEGSAPVIGLP